MSVELVWATPDCNKVIGYLARVSNPKAKPDDDAEKLVGYLMDHHHWSPLEMANICVGIKTTRDIGRQMIRHRSFHFQEFSQRYAEVEQATPILANARLQDTKNRQASIDTEDPMLQDHFEFWQKRVWDVCYIAYRSCLKMGIAKELARKLLPEGLTETTMYINGTVRDWYHYLVIRTDPLTVQREHVDLAQEILAVCEGVCPSVFSRVWPNGG